jgi:hypothetical protein
VARSDESGRRRRKRDSKSLLAPGLVLASLTLAVALAVGVIAYRVAAARRKPPAPQTTDRPADPAAPRDAAARPEDLLIGRWAGRHPEDPAREVRYEFTRGGEFTLAAVHPGLATVTVRGTYRVLGGTGRKLRLTMRTESREVTPDPGNQVRPMPDDGPKEYEAEVELVSADRLRLTTTTGRVFDAARQP